MASFDENLDRDIFIQFREKYFINIDILGDIHRYDFDKVYTKLTERLKSEVLFTKRTICSWIDLLQDPSAGVTYFRILKYQAEDNNIENSEILLQAYINYKKFHTLSIDRERLWFNPDLGSLFHRMFIYYQESYNDLLKFVDETFMNFQKGYYINNKDVYTKLILKEILLQKPIFVLHNDIKLSSLKKKGDNKLVELNLNQTAILFLYLKKYHSILEYNTDSFATLLYYLTGHSEHNLSKESLSRIEDYFGERTHLKKKILMEDENDFLKIRDLLKLIINDIESNFQFYNKDK